MMKRLYTSTRPSLYVPPSFDRESTGYFHTDTLTSGPPVMGPAAGPPPAALAPAGAVGRNPASNRQTTSAAAAPPAAHAPFAPMTTPPDWSPAAPPGAAQRGRRGRAVRGTGCNRRTARPPGGGAGLGWVALLDGQGRPRIRGPLDVVCRGVGRGASGGRRTAPTTRAKF